MKKYILFLTISLVLILLLSCKLPLSTDPPNETEEWGCLINSDGTGFEWVMRGDTQATFTQDSQKIVYRRSNGIFTRDFVGNVEQISSLAYDDYNLISPDLQYVLQEDENDIYWMNIDGSNRINLTETPESKEYDTYITPDGNWINFVAEIDTVYSIWMMDINGANQTEVMTDTINALSKPKINLLNNRMYFVSIKEFGVNVLSSFDLGFSKRDSLSSMYGIKYKLSGSGNVCVFGIWEFGEVYKLYIYDLFSEQFTIIDNTYSSFDVNWEGYMVVMGGGMISIFNYTNNEIEDLISGDYPTLSPDGEKIFFIKDRELPIED